MRILLIEDEAQIQRFIKRGPAAAGFQVDVAHNGEEGIPFGQRHYSRILLDFLLPLKRNEGLSDFA